MIFQQKILRALKKAILKIHASCSSSFTYSFLKPVPAGISLPIMTFSLRPKQFVFAAHNRRFYQNSGRVLKRRGGQKSRSGQSDFGYRHNRRFKLGRILAVVFRLFVLFQSLWLFTASPALRSVSPESMTLYLENICLIITSMCFSLMLAPCME